MAKIVITLVNAQDGQSYPSEVVTDKPVGWWIEQILQALYLPREENGQQIEYQFILEQTGQVVSEQENLQSSGVHAGDILRLERVKAESQPFEQAYSRSIHQRANLPRRVWVAGGVLLVAVLAVVGMLTNGQASEQAIATTAATSGATITSTNTPYPTTTTIPTKTQAATPTPYEIIDTKGVPMVLVPAGEFIVGSEQGDLDEQPVRTVFVDAFYIDKYEVTNNLYRLCVQAGVCSNPYKKKLLDQHFTYYGGPQYDNHAVTDVDWEMAAIYCRWRGARLPTEAEWEKAARGIDGRTYPWGESIDCAYANYKRREDSVCMGHTGTVGVYQSGLSPFGVFDMAGNVWEWVADWYQSDYYRTIGMDTNNPQGPSSGKYRVVRGGSWDSLANDVRSSNRSYLNPIEASRGVGFRCVRSP